MSPDCTTDSRSNFSTAYLVAFFIFFAAFYALFVRGIPPNGDPVNYFVVAQNLVETGTFGMEKNQYVPLEQGRDGAYYSKFAPGQSLLEAPFYALGRMVAPSTDDQRYLYAFKYFVSVLCVPPVSALTLIFFMLTIQLLGYDRRTAILSTLLLGLGTMMWPYARLGFSEPLQACAIAAGFYYSTRARREGSLTAAAFAGAAIGMLLLTKVSAAIVAPGFALYLITGAHGQKKRFRAAMLFSLVFLIFLCLSLAYNQLRFGELLNFGYFSGKDASFGFNVNCLSGLYGFLFSPGKSIFLYAPAVLLSLWGARRLQSDHGDVSTLVWFCVASHLAVYCRWWAWHGDWSWGPRFLVPLMPLLMIPAAALVATLKESVFIHRFAFITIVVVSFFIQTLGVAVNPYEYIMITRHQVPHGPFFTPGREDLRDDQTGIHFVPDFSPVAGHWWLLKHTITGAGRTAEQQRAAMQKDFPWRGLMRYAVPPHPERGAVFDFWWVYFPEYFPESTTWVKVFLMSLLFMVITVPLFGFIAKRRANKFASEIEP